MTDLLYLLHLVNNTCIKFQTLLRPRPGVYQQSSVAVHHLHVLVSHMWTALVKCQFSCHWPCNYIHTHALLSRCLISWDHCLLAHPWSVQKSDAQRRFLKLYVKLCNKLWAGHTLEASLIPHLNDCGHKREPFVSWAGEKLLYMNLSSLDRGSDSDMRKLSKILSVVLVNLPPPHEQCSRGLHITDYPFINNICTLMATPTQTPASDGFTSNRRRKLFFDEEALFSQWQSWLEWNLLTDAVMSMSPPANNNNTAVNITLHF